MNVPMNYSRIFSRIELDYLVLEIDWKSDDNATSAQASEYLERLLG